MSAMSLKTDIARSTDEHECCYHLDASRRVLADRERELLELKGPCSNKRCRLHYAHSGPCDVRPPDPDKRIRSLNG